ncbi:retropepsin-like aspartic protease [Pedobacter duraquae]|uniref:Aspartyl protease n=1 Tax=Pedobacter duraquae TaxID=425511 RepID=A0A4R6II57_9SPHI|nr:retropepsin-like aspartic protease [Pedobacter duraquae]TDO21630.1 aspartyl protease [Pedobacter duraquae]
MKRISLFFLMMSVTLITQAQTFTYNAGGAAGKNYYQELPYQDINGKMIVQVKVGGQTANFLFDTGAPTSISKELAKASGATFLRNAPVTDAGGLKDSTSVVLPKSIRLGEVEFNDIPAVTLVPDFFKCWGVTGIIGSNLLRNSVVQIDAVKKRIILTDQPEKLNLNPKNAIPLLLSKGQSDPRIQIKLAKKVSMTMGFDTGDNSFLRLSEDFMNQLSKSKVFEVLSEGYGATRISAFGEQKAADKFLLRFANFELGSGKFSNVVTYTDKNGIPGIGTKLLEYGLVTLDYMDKKFYFEPYKEITDLNETRWPFELSLDGDKLIFGAVWKSAAGQLKQGEQILAINEKEYPAVSLCQMLTSPSVFKGLTSAVLKIKDADGAIRTVTVKREIL